MPRIALIGLLWLGMASAARAQALSPHLSPGVVPTACAACHKGHGQPRSPMLPAPQTELCLSCHGSATAQEEQVRRGNLAAGVEAPLLGMVLSRPFVHPLSPGAFSRREPGAVTCTSCHSPHRPATTGSSDVPTGRRYFSPRDPQEFEFELCESCHGNAGASTQSLVDLSRLLDPNNRSYHPVEAPSIDLSPSVIPRLSGREINCTDCHGDSNPLAPRGPHGSAVPYILRSSYATTDGAQESPVVYGLCYDCHRREAVLETSTFPLHREHVVEARASCATCHNPHGSVDNRSLIRFGEETTIAGVAPSPSTGRLAFVSAVPGSGACYLSCHGFDHGPASYGDEGSMAGALASPSIRVPTTRTVRPPVKTRENQRRQ